MRVLLLVIALLVLTGCGPSGCSRVLPPVSDAVPPPPAAESMGSLAEARQAVVYYQAQVAALEASAAAERIEAQQRWLSWLMGICFALAIVCFALAWVVPVGRKTLFTMALACAGSGVAAYILGQLVGWLPVIAVVAAVAALAWLAWALWRRLQVALHTVDTAVDRNDPSWPALKGHLKEAQGKFQKEMDRLASRVRKW